MNPIERYFKLVETMPEDAAPELRKAWKLYALAAVSTLGKRKLERVQWPWQPVPVPVRVPRGRPR